MKQNLKKLFSHKKYTLETPAFIFMIVTFTLILAAVLAIWRTVGTSSIETDPYRICSLYAAKNFTVSALWLCLCEALGGGLLMDYARKYEREK